MVKRPLNKILIIDDDDDILVITKLCLQMIPNVVITCSISGEAGIEEAIKSLPDLILLDVMMPKMDGIATLKKLQLLPATALIPVIFFTAKAQIDDTKTYLSYGIIDIITKPFEPLTLADRILSIWDKYLESATT